MSLVMLHSLQLHVGLDVDAISRKVPIQRRVKQRSENKKSGAALLFVSTDKATVGSISKRPDQLFRLEEPLTQSRGVGYGIVKIASSIA